MYIDFFFCRALRYPSMWDFKTIFSLTFQILYSAVFLSKSNAGTGSPWIEGRGWCQSSFSNTTERPAYELSTDHYPPWSGWSGSVTGMNHANRSPGPAHWNLNPALRSPYQSMTIWSIYGNIPSLRWFYTTMHAHCVWQWAKELAISQSILIPSASHHGSISMLLTAFGPPGPFQTLMNQWTKYLCWFKTTKLASGLLGSVTNMPQKSHDTIEPTASSKY